MARTRTRTLTELELVIMNILWDREEATVEDLRKPLMEAGRALAPPSIRKMLEILQNKGYVRRKLAGRAHVYQATVPADQAQKRILADIVERAFDGSAMDLVAALVGHKMISKRDLAKIRRLIEQREKGGRR